MLGKGRADDLRVTSLKVFFYLKELYYLFSSLHNLLFLFFFQIKKTASVVLTLTVRAVYSSEESTIIKINCCLKLLFLRPINIVVS